MFALKTIAGKRCWLLATLAAAMLVQAGTQARADDVQKWDMVGYLGLNAPISQLFADFAKEVEAETEGRVVITLRAPGELPYAAGEYHRVVGNGDVAMADTAWFTSDVPASGLLTTAMLIQNFDDLRKAMPVVHDQINEGLGRFGSEILFWYAHPPIKFYGKGDAPQDLAGISGLKVRALTPEHTELLGLLGATAVPIAAPELITAIQYGTVNAALTTAVGVLSLQWQDVLDWSYEMEIAPTPSYIIVNSEMMAALSEHDQEVLRRLGAKYQEKILQNNEKQEQEIQDDLQAKGMVVVPASDADRAKLFGMVEPLWAGWAGKRGEDTVVLLGEIRKVVGR